MDDWHPLPERAAWRLHDAHDGFEHVAITSRADGAVFAGATIGVEAGAFWDVRYRIEVDSGWLSRRIRVDRGGDVSVIERDRVGWLVDGERRDDLDDCADVDLEGSLLTNLFAIRRLRLAIGEERAVSAVYVHTMERRVSRSEQRYRRLGEREFRYGSPDGSFRALLRLDDAALTRSYEGLGTRVA
jgi:hypothetical protein